MLFIVGGIILLPAFAFSQQATSLPVPPDNNGSAGSSAGLHQDSADILTSNQILVIVQQKPEVVVDLKKVMADYFAQHKTTAMQQGTAIDENSITDEMLYSNIAANADLRASMTEWLRARGYISAVAIETSKSRRDDDDRAEEDDDDSGSVQPTSSSVTDVFFRQCFVGYG